MITQPFTCEACNIRGDVQLEDDASIIQAINLIKEAHSILSPDCPFQVDKIIVWAPPDE